MEEKKKTIVYVVISIGLLLSAIVGATFAYFRAQVGDGANVNINASSGTTDSLMFEKGDAIEILAHQGNFGKDEEGNVESITKETFVRARLIPNNTNNQANAKYNVYFVIDKNDFIYTTKEQTPELVLKITNPKGDEVTEIPGLTYVKASGGFDITTKKSNMYAFKIFEDYPIEANGKEEVQEWKIEVTLVNLTSNQNENGGKTFNGRIHITTDEQEVYKLYNIKKIDTDTTYESINATLDIDNGTSGVDKYYYAIEKTDEEPSPVKINLLATDLGKKYIASDSPTYNFTTDEEGNPLEASTNYKIYSYIIDKEGYQSNIYSTVVTTDKYDLVKITDLIYETTWNSISITGVNTTPGTGTASEYSFKKDSDENWTEYSTNQTYTISGLDEQNQVTVMVQVKDNNGRFSNPYEKVIITDAYNYSTITNFNVSDITINSMKVKVGVNKGQSNINKVEVQYVGESENTWHEATLIDGLYTIDFNGLSLGTKYDFKIRVTDEYKTKVYEDTSYTGTTLNTHRVSVTVTNGNADASSKDIIHGQTATFTITANSGYYINDAKVIEGNCTLGNVSGKTRTLTASNVMSDISCKVDIPKRVPLKEYIVTQVGKVVGGELIQHTAADPTSAGDNGYRYSGNNPNNFICFGKGSEAYNRGDSGVACAPTNQYRIIGLVPVTKSDGNTDTLVKVIKSEYITKEELGKGANDGTVYSNSSYTDKKRVEADVTNLDGFYWNNTEDNTWDSSTLKVVLNNSETGYLSKLKNSSDGIDWTEKIEEVKWNVGGVDDNDITPKAMKEAEESSESEVTAQIGLMYIYDYGFASAKENWNTTLYSYDNDKNRSNNWLFNGVYEWTTSCLSGISNFAFNVGDSGFVDLNDVNYTSDGVRPVFYLKSNVEIKSDGAVGSSTYPFRIQ